MPTNEEIYAKVMKIRAEQKRLAETKEAQSGNNTSTVQKIIKNLTGDATKVDKQLVDTIANNATTSLYFMSMASQLSQNTISCVKIFEDPEATDSEKAAGVFGVLASASAVGGMFGPLGVAIGSFLNTTFAVLQMILQSTAPHREDELTKLERRLREMKAEDVAQEIKAARETFGLKLVALASFEPGSRTWDQENHNTHGSDHFALAKTNAWLSSSANHRTETWEEVFTGYAHATMDAMHLLITLQQKLAAEEQAPILAYMRQYGRNLSQNFGALRPLVARCGAYYVITRDNHDVLRMKKPGQPERQGVGWDNVQFGYPHSLSISPRNGRFWAEYKNDGHPLTTGSTEGEVGLHLLESPPVTGCVDIGLQPFLDATTDLLLVCVEKPNPFCKGDLPVLILNEWKEKRSRFFSKTELEQDWAKPDEKDKNRGFTKDWWKPALHEGVVMARFFRAKPPQASAAADDQDFVYLLCKRKPAPEANVQGMVYTLEYVPLRQLGREPTFPLTLEVPNPVWEYTGTPVSQFASLPHELSKNPSNVPLRISVTRKYVYLYSRRAAWRALHELVLTPPKLEVPENASVADKNKIREEQGRLRLAVWEPVALPERAANPDSGYQELTSLSGWWSDGLNDLNAWSDDHVVAVLGTSGEMWAGDFDSARATAWEEFDLHIDTGKDLPEGGKSLIAISATTTAEGGDPGKAKLFGYKLRIRVFDETRKMVVDKDETELLARADLKLLQAKLTDDVLSGKTSVRAVRHVINPIVARLVGPAWRWTRTDGNALRIVKPKNTSFTLGQRLIEAGEKWQAGQMVPDPN